MVITFESLVWNIFPRNENFFKNKNAFSIFAVKLFDVIFFGNYIFSIFPLKVMFSICIQFERQSDDSFMR